MFYKENFLNTQCHQCKKYNIEYLYYGDNEALWCNQCSKDCFYLIPANLPVIKLI